MKNEKKFNFWFSAVLLAGMVGIAIYSFVCEVQDPQTRLLMQVIATLAAITGVTNTVLSANGSIWTFLFGLIDVVCCSIVYLDSGIMGTFALHAFYFLPMQFIGFWQWRKRGAGDRIKGEDGRSEEAKVKARRLTGKQWSYVLAAFVAGIAIAFVILHAIDAAKLRAGALDSIDNAKILLDAGVVVLNILGQVLMSFAFAEQWYIWIMVNIFSIMLWTNRLVSPEATSYTMVMLVKYIFYFINSINGLRIWLKLSR
ncbi:MAG: nicotinamide mononucleotide transporter [Bacteroidales bacterium]|nr:nicotinamide mononucleotide transporter [Bacteroidales bacterium]